MTVDKSQLLANDPTLVAGEPTPKVSMQGAIEAAKAAVAEKVEAERRARAVG